MSTHATPLLDGFPIPTHEEWKAEAVKLLKGAPFESKLLTPTPEGITLEPIYHRSTEHLPSDGDWAGLASGIRGNRASGLLGSPLKISQELPYSLPSEFNRIARADVARGQTEIHLLLDSAGRAGRDPDQANAGEVGACGTSICHLADLQKALDGLTSPSLSLAISAGPSALPIGILLLALARQGSLDLAQLQGALLHDPVSEYARTGTLPASLDTHFREMALLTRAFHERAPRFKTIAIDTQVVHESGGHGVQELAYGLALAATYARELEKRGVPPAVTFSSVRFCVAVGPHFFAEIAKLRAARILWSSLLTACGIDTASCRCELHARTALRDKTCLDPYTNMLRTTTGAMSAVLGGCSSLHTGPYDEVFQVPDDFSRRIARNTPIILVEECGLDRVVDPAGGSWFVESLTRALVEKSWAAFQDIEKQGGLLAVLTEGSFQKNVTSSAESRAKALGQRRAVMVGVNNYPNPRETFTPPRLPDYTQIHQLRAREIATHRLSADHARDLEILEALSMLAVADGPELVDTAINAVLHGATLGELVRVLRPEAARIAPPAIPPLPMRRTAVLYENLRLACARAAANGSLPSVLQLNLGPSRAYRARADWTTNFFLIAGLPVDGARDFKDADDALAATRTSRSPVVVLCGQDETYATMAASLARALKSLPTPPLVLLAGTPGDQEAPWREAGIDDFIHVRVPHHTFVSNLLHKLGII
jgi:methylmalonyl-CoA mutase